MAAQFFGESGPIAVPRRRFEEHRAGAEFPVEAPRSTPPGGNRVPLAERPRTQVVDDHGRDRVHWEIS